ncbi:DUF4159 domain-containing protein [Tropicimonas sp. S265A]|uniref:DUF4159 domain-containing protein n=1 Tax=Tropicimonas sp. S265A TaxID=3415134 RepID=UPI003C7D0F12
MFAIGPIAFATPWLLALLVALPILWLILRAVPPAPITRRFPGVALLLGLEDPESETDKTPWWLLLLRALAVAAMIIGFAGPILNPDERTPGSGPLLVVADASWASARDWGARRERIDAILSEAARDGRPVALVQLTDLPAPEIAFGAPEELRARLAGVDPRPWPVNAEEVSDWLEQVEGSFDTFWMSDGLAYAGRDSLLAAFEARGTVRVFESPRVAYALRPPVIETEGVTVDVLRNTGSTSAEITVIARGPGPNGISRELGRAEVAFDEGAGEVAAVFDLPPELRNRITQFEIPGQPTAGAVALADDGLRRREIALFTGRDDREGLELLTPLHYLRRALAPTADLLEVPFADALLANPDVVILADVAQLAEAEARGLTDWVEQGGLLLRFAGPRLAASEVSRAEEDPLLPVRLRAGGRSVGGAMSWGEPKTLRAFAETSPFYGLPIPSDVVVSAQVMAQPDPDLPQRVIASLTDGTPLVTRKALGQGQVVLMHVTANAEWSTLPLSGLFVQMLERMAVSSRPAALTAEALAGTTWIPEQRLGPFGTLEDAGQLAGIAGEVLAEAPLGADVPPGLYSGSDRVIARNVMTAETELAASSWPARIEVEGLEATRDQPLAGWLLTAALLLLAVDILAALWLSGRLRSGAAKGAAAAALVIGVALGSATATPGMAQETPGEDDALALLATTDVVLAHVITGDTRVDELAFAGLRGLSQVLMNRTSIEPSDPISVNIETDELAFFPFLYWPVTDRQQLPTAEAYAKLNRYLRGGGMILFDTRDADVGQFNSDTPGMRTLRRLAAPLDVPPLEPLPADHVLTRTFYLLQDFPGRFTSRTLWVEAAPPDAEQVEGMPFRNLNDGVTPVVIGGNDWAAAWAVSEDGRAMTPIGRGFSGRQQRELAYRFGVNLIMHVLTGNYKSDQVHVPALLERLGQ